MTHVATNQGAVKPKRQRAKKSNINQMRSRGEMIALPDGARLWTAPGYLARRRGASFIDAALLADECAGRA